MNGDDNSRGNTHDRSFEVLSNFWRIPNETADDLASMFSYLTVEDIAARLHRATVDEAAAGPSLTSGNPVRQKRRPLCPGGSPSAQKSPDPSPLPASSQLEKNSTPGTVSLSEFLDPSKCKLRRPPHHLEDAYVEEEVLLEGSTSMERRHPPKKTLTKFDNFLWDKEVEEEEGQAVCDDPDIGDILQGGGYQASFQRTEDSEPAKNPRVSFLASLNKNVSERQPASPDSSQWLLDKEVYDEAANFLAHPELSVCLEKQDHSKAFSAASSSSPDDVLASWSCLRGHMDKNRNSHSEEDVDESPEKETGDSQLKEYNSLFLSDKDAGASKSDSTTEDAEAQEDEIERYILQQVKSSQRREVEEDAEDFCSEVISLGEGFGSCSPIMSSNAYLQNPGEVEADEKKEEGKCADVNLRCLDFVAVKAKANSEVSGSAVSSETADHPESSVCEVCSDEVMPFVLDENFDYDNVVLTPKFSAEEMAFLNSFRPTTNSGHI